MKNIMKNLLMKLKFKNFLTSSTILSAPGIISIFISLLSIPIHLNYAGPESYGNDIIFTHIASSISLLIGKSVAISM